MLEIYTIFVDVLAGFHEGFQCRYDTSKR